MTHVNFNLPVKADLHGVTCPVKPILISPPFGNYIKTPFTTSVKGSFTWQKRPGLVRQILRTLRTTSGGYVNQIGLRNRGIQQVHFYERYVYSIVGMTAEEWDLLMDFLPSSLKLEMNIGCPNHWQNHITRDQIQRFVRKFPHLTLKMSPLNGIEELDRLAHLGINRFHLCNTLPSPQGGISGLQLKRVVLPLIEQARHCYPHIHIIGGGGIYTFQDAMDFYQAGAHSFSLATVWFNPIRALRLIQRLHRFFNQEGVNVSSQTLPSCSIPHTATLEGGDKYANGD